MQQRQHSRWPWLAAFLTLAIVLTGALAMGADASKSSQTAASRNEQASCANIQRLNLEKQMNAHAAEILASCGRGSAQRPGAATTYTATNFTSLGSARPRRRTEARTSTIITGGEGPSPHVTQSETLTWAEGNTIVTTFNDSRTAAIVLLGRVVLARHGATWLNLNTRPFCSGHGTGYGDPVSFLRPGAREVGRRVPRLRVRRPGHGRLVFDQQRDLDDRS